MKKLFVFIVLGLVVFAAQNARAQSCYITQNNDYICDDTVGAGGAHGGTVQRDTLNDISGSNYVFQADDIRSQFFWLPGVLAQMGSTVASTPSSGATSVGTIPESGASGVGTADWSGVECEAGTDPRVAAQKEILDAEGYKTTSYYDGKGSACTWQPPKSQGGGCDPNRWPYCGNCAAGCLTIGIGHLVLASEMSKWSPCGTPICPGDATAQKACVDDLFINADFPRYWNAAVEDVHDMCLSDSEASCLLVALTPVHFQLGQNWVMGRQGYTGHAGDAMMAGQFKTAATRLDGSSYCQTKEYRARCMKLVTALNAVGDQAAGCDGTVGN